MYRITILTLVFCIAASIELVASAQITVEGNVAGATYNGFDDPWDISTDPDAGESELELAVGQGDAGTLSILGGSEVINVNNRLLIGSRNPSLTGDGLVTVSGNGSVLNNGGDRAGIIQIGTVGTGTLDVLDGGLVESRQAFVGGAFSTVSGRGFANVSGAGSRLIVDEFLTLASRDFGRLTVSDGGFVEGGLRFGSFGSQVDAKVTVTGDGSRLVGTGQVGTASGNASLSILDGGSVEGIFSTGNSFGQSGEILVDGNGSQLSVSGSRFFNFVGGSGTGNLTVRNGGTANYGSTLTVGQEESGEGIVSVTGENSVLQALSLTVGQFGSGQVDISNGGQVFAGSAAIGISTGGSSAESSGEINISGTGSTLSGIRSLEVGVGGEGRFNVRQGASVVLDSSGFSSGFVSIGEGGDVFSDSSGNPFIDEFGFASFFTEGSGVIAVEGQNSRFEAAEIAVGDTGAGKLEVKDGGTVAANNVSIGGDVSLVAREELLFDDFQRQESQFLGQAIISGNGATLEIDGSLNIGDQIFRPVGLFADGLLSVEDGGVVTVGGTTVVGEFGNLYVGDGGTFATNRLVDERLTGSLVPGVNIADGGTLFVGTVSNSIAFDTGTLAATTIEGNLLQNGGILSPGNSPGITTVEGDYSLLSGAVLIELFNLSDEILTPGEDFDQIIVGGDALLGENASLDLVLGFEADLDTTFTILTASSVTGDFGFGQITSQFGDFNYEFDIIYNSDNIGLRVASITAIAVPEPTAGLLLVGMGLLPFLRRKRLS